MFCIQIAEVLIAIKNRYAFTERLCADYIVDTSPDDCDISIAATPEEIAAENDEKGSFSPAYCESLALYRKICTRMLDFNAFLFHAAIISYAEQGFAFTAKSGTGKSTHIAQWVRARRARNDGERRQAHSALANRGSCRASRWDAQRGRRMCLYLFRCAP